MGRGLTSLASSPPSLCPRPRFAILAICLLVIIAPIQIALAIQNQLCLASADRFGFVFTCADETSSTFSLPTTPLLSFSYANGSGSTLNITGMDYAMEDLPTSGIVCVLLWGTGGSVVKTALLNSPYSSQVLADTSFGSSPAQYYSSASTFEPKIVFLPWNRGQYNVQSLPFCYSVLLPNLTIYCNGAPLPYLFDFIAPPTSMASIDFMPYNAAAKTIIVGISTINGLMGSVEVNISDASNPSVFQYHLDTFDLPANPLKSKVVFSPDGAYLCGITISQWISPSVVVLVMCSDRINLGSNRTISNLTDGGTTGDVLDFDIYFSQSGRTLCWWARFESYNPGPELRIKCVPPWPSPSDLVDDDVIFEMNLGGLFDLNAFSVGTLDYVAGLVDENLTSSVAVGIYITANTFIAPFQASNKSQVIGNTVGLLLAPSPSGKRIVATVLVSTGGPLIYSLTSQADSPFQMIPSPSFSGYGSLPLGSTHTLFSPQSYTMLVCSSRPPSLYVDYAFGALDSSSLSEQVNSSLTWSGVIITPSGNTSMVSTSKTFFKYTIGSPLGSQGVPSPPTPVPIPTPSLDQSPSPLPAETPSPSSPSSQITCGAVPAGLSQLNCIDGQWVVNSSSVNIDLATSFESSISFGGNVTVSNNVQINVTSAFVVKGTLVLGQGTVVFFNSSTPITVEGCVEPSTAQLKVAVEKSGSQTVLTYSCTNQSSVGSIQGVTRNPCDKVTASPQYLASQLVVDFTVVKGAACAKEPVSESPNIPLIVGLVVALVVVSAVVVAVVFGVPSVRKKVFPHRDRQTRQTSSSR